MSQFQISLTLLAAVVIGFLAGAALSKLVIGDALALEARMRSAFDAVSNDIHNLHAKIDGKVQEIAKKV